MTPELTDIEISRCYTAQTEAEDAAYDNMPPRDQHGPIFLGVLAALVEYHRILEERGYVVVPKEPTEAMLNSAPASFSQSFMQIWPKICGDIYRAMIAAAEEPNNDHS